MAWFVVRRESPPPLVAAFLFGAGAIDMRMYACRCGRYDGKCEAPPVM